MLQPCAFSSSVQIIISTRYSNVCVAKCGHRSGAKVGTTCSDDHLNTLFQLLRHFDDRLKHFHWSIDATTWWPFVYDYINNSIDQLSVTVCCMLMRLIFMFRNFFNLINDLFQNLFLCTCILIQWLNCLFHRFSLVVVIVAGFENRFHSSTGDRKMSKHIAIFQNIDFYICLNISEYFRIFQNISEYFRIFGKSEYFRIF